MNIQDLNLELIKQSSFNEFDGEAVVKDLQANTDLWKAVIIDRAGYRHEIDFIKLRDLPDNYWNVDTLYISVKAGKETELTTLANSWDADEIGWIDNTDAGKVLRVWWD